MAGAAAQATAKVVEKVRPEGIGGGEIVHAETGDVLFELLQAGELGFSTLKLFPAQQAGGVPLDVDRWHAAIDDAARRGHLRVLSTD